jgi:hypothetical protein
LDALWFSQVGVPVGSPRLVSSGNSEPCLARLGCNVVEEDGKNDFRQAKKTLHKAPALKEDGKNDFRQAKITFGALTPPQGTSSGGRW